MTWLIHHPFHKRAGGFQGRQCDEVKPDIRAIPFDEDGMRMDLLEAELERIGKGNPRLKFCYTIPNFQNPGGVTMNAERRRGPYCSDTARAWGLSTAASTARRTSSSGRSDTAGMPPG